MSNPTVASKSEWRLQDYPGLQSVFPGLIMLESELNLDEMTWRHGVGQCHLVASLRQRQHHHAGMR